MATRKISGTLDTFESDGAEITYVGSTDACDRSENIRGFRVNPGNTGDIIVKIDRSTGVKSVEMDNSGRFLISKDLIKYASIDKEIVVSSSVNILEIWNKSTYEKVINEATLNFGALAEEVMGDKNYGSIS